MSRTYPVHEAKAKLSEILRRVQRGGGVVISDRGRAVARVVPMDEPKTLGERLDRLAQEGVLQRPVGPVTLIKPVARRRGVVRRFVASRA